MRETLFPNEGPAAWNGIMLWRGATDWPAFMTGRSMIVAGGNTAKFVVYPIAEGSAAGPQAHQLGGHGQGQRRQGRRPARRTGPIRAAWRT